MRAPLICLVLLVACGGNSKSEPPDESPRCGNGLLEAGEECDDDDTVKDLTCDASCHFTCGNGALDRDIGELCDTKIASGPGACPTSCDDHQACTADVLMGSGCLAECMHSSITAPANGDGCCPAGANANNDNDCAAACGNGVAEPGEACDTAIASGAGACPTACDDMVACTRNVLGNAGTCQAACSFPPITMTANGDGCCPAGANANIDSDCAPVCGNGVLEPGEACDTAIASGAGACPTACDDMLVCTRDVLGNAGTCQAACTFPPITTPASGDGCCPAGANANNDNDCAAVCGNGVVEPSELCDKAIASGPGACPTTCDDGVACTYNVLGNAGTCQTVCVFPAITTPASGDGCCPTGANATNDSDCAPVCGNGVLEPGEQCDDGNTNDNDACSNACAINGPPTAFRFTDLDLRDPHVFVSFFGCQDVTDFNLLVPYSLNDALQTSIQSDSNLDGLLDLSPTLVFRPFSTTAATMPLDVHMANCTAPMSSTTCTAGPLMETGSATNVTTGACLTPLPGTTRPYSPAISVPTPPCFVSSSFTVTITVSGIPITLHDGQASAHYADTPVTSFTSGLLRGFLSQADADATIIPASFPIVGGQPLSSLLPGGTGACTSYSDKDTNAGVVGWWFYLSFSATRVPWQ